MPSSAAIQRALSATSTPSLKPSASDASTTNSQPQKVLVPADARETPRWPVSPRLRSPPPAQNRIGAMPGKQDVPTLTNLRFHSSNEGSNTSEGSEESPVMTALRSPTRGPSTSSTSLATVQEVSQPGSPAAGMDGANDKQLSEVVEEPIALEDVPPRDRKSKSAVGAESGNESAGGPPKTEVKLKPTPSGILRPTIVPTLKSAPSGTFKKPSESSSAKNMTVETETVSTIPIVPVSAQINGSLRAKQSSETIRPRKEKKKVRKPTSVAGGGKTPDSSDSRALSFFRPPTNKTRSHMQSIRPDTIPSILKSPISIPYPNGKPSSVASTQTSSLVATAMISQGNGCYQTGGYFSNFSFDANSSPPLLARIPTNASTASITSNASSVATITSLHNDPSSFFKNTIRDLLTPKPIASSKADIFEAKIASAVDEAASSDSEETFVYESNPPDHDPRRHRYHSRTPSVTSMASAAAVDSRSRSMQSGMDGGPGNGGNMQTKKSMKFANSFAQPIQDGGMSDDGYGAPGRMSGGTGRGTVRHHHIGRWGRNGGGHPSLFDNEVFSNAKSKFGTSSKNSSRPPSPRVVGGGKFSRKNLGPFDDDGADDERTPLVPSSIRSQRSGRYRRPGTRGYDRPAYGGRQSCMSRFASCIVVTFMVLLVLSGAVGFLFATSQPLLEVQIVSLSKVLASENELMFDVEIEARNPNLMGVWIENVSLSINAKSKWAGKDDDGWFNFPPIQFTNTMRRRGSRITELDEDGNDIQTLDDSPLDPAIPPGSDPSDGRPLLLLGHVEHLDNSLYFEGSPFRHTHSHSTGEIRITNPGNATEDGGVDRWKEVLKHDWDLVVQGLVKYELPLSGRQRSAQVGGRVSVVAGDDSV